MQIIKPPKHKTTHPIQSFKIELKSIIWAINMNSDIHYKIIAIYLGINSINDQIYLIIKENHQL